jgi:hypothetical protein
MLCQLCTSITKVWVEEDMFIEIQVFWFSHVPQFCDAICSMSFESLGLEQPSDVPMVSDREKRSILHRSRLHRLFHHTIPHVWKVVVVVC